MKNEEKTSIKSGIIHGIKRIAILMLSWLLAIPIGYICFNILFPFASLEDGDIDALIIFLIIYCFSFLWIIGLGIETIILNRKKRRTERDINLIMLGISLLIFILSTMGILSFLLQMGILPGLLEEVFNK